MKLCLAIPLIVFLSIEANGSRVKRGLSADEQKKFLEELNKDRKKIADEDRFEFVPMKYDASLEKEIVSGKKCFEDKSLFPLRINDVAEQYREHMMKIGSLEGDIYQAYFLPKYDKIGCSKEAKCTDILTKEMNGPAKLEGKTVEYYGLCVLGSSGTEANNDPKKLKKAKTPSPIKYAVILGIPAGNQGSGMDGTNEKQGSGVEGSGISGTVGEQGSGAGSVFSLMISLFLVLYI